MRNPQAIYLEHLANIDSIAAFVARKGHLNADECEDFVQAAHLRLIEDNYAIIRKFEGRSTFTTYLMTVIGRFLYQGRVEHWGKWRPSAEALRLGDTAVTLERLLTRDGYSFSEAVGLMTTRADARTSVSELAAIYVRLPSRQPRPRLISDEVSPDAVAVDGDADERVQGRDRVRTARKAAEVIDGVGNSLGAEDRLILQLRFVRARKVPEIARVLGMDQKKVYKRLDKLFAVLRRDLETAGVSRAEVEMLLASGDQEIHLDLLSAEENGAFRPSNSPGEGIRGGEETLP
jgi:RNA polymerase sigma factor (sigma-70 family)